MAKEIKEQVVPLHDTNPIRKVPEIDELEQLADQVSLSLYIYIYYNIV